MAEKKKTIYADINLKQENFVLRLIGYGKSKHDFSDIALLRKILTKQKAKILYILKHEKPGSIYALSKILKRDFKSVREDLKLLERFGLIEFHITKKGKRKSLIPVLIIDKLQIIIGI